MSLRFGRLEVVITFWFTVFLAALLMSPAGKSAGWLLLSALVHEAAHALSLLCFGADRITLYLLPGGARMRAPALSALPYRAALFSALAGPAASLLTAAVFYCLALRLRRPAFAPLAEMNLTLGAVNLLPLSFLDGGAALAAALSMRKKKTAPPRFGRSDLAITAGITLVSAVLLCMGVRARLFSVFSCYCVFCCLTSPGGRRIRPALRPRAGSGTPRRRARRA